MSTDDVHDLKVFVAFEVAWAEVVFEVFYLEIFVVAVETMEVVLASEVY